MYICLQVKCQLFLSDFNETWIFRTDFRKIPIPNSIKIIQWQPNCSMWTDDGQTDMTKLIVAFRDFANAQKKSLALYSDSSPGPSSL